MTLTRMGITNVTDSVLSDILDALDENTMPLIAETSGTFSFDETSAAEQQVVSFAITGRTKITSIWFDMTNVTQDTDIRLYHEVDSANSRLFQENAWVTTDDDGVLIDGFAVGGDFRIVMICGGGGAGSVDVPYQVI